MKRAARSAVRRSAGAIVNAGLRTASPVISVRARRLGRRSGLRRSAFLLSFDCDTDLDIEVVGKVHESVVALGVRPSYAVPGDLLRRGAEMYGSLAEAGAEFLNHGDRQHCEFDPATGRYESSFFYDGLSTAAVEADVRGGHAAHLEVLGRPPTGFRTPHFGTYGRTEQLEHLHSLLAAMGYRFSSSTGPWFALRHGPLLRTSAGVTEIPVSGVPAAPLRPLDSWSFRFAPRPLGDGDDYLEAVRTLARAASRPGAATLVNLYVDPSQVADWPPFLEAVRLLAPLARPSFEALLDEVGR